MLQLYFPNLQELTPETALPLTAESSSEATGAGAYTIFFRPQGDFAYAPNTTDGTIQRYSVDHESGALTSLGYTSAVGVGAFAAITPSGLWLYTTDYAGNKILAYGINPATGALTGLGHYNPVTGTSPLDVVISPDGAHLYVALYSGHIAQYEIDPGTGGLTSLGADVAVYSGESAISVLTMHGGGGYLFGCHNIVTTVARWSRNATTGLLTALVGLNRGRGGQTCLAVGDHLYVANTFVGDACSIDHYSITAGVLAFVDQVSTPDDRLVTKFGTDGAKTIFTPGEDTVSRWEIDSAGSLTLLETAGGPPWGLAWSATVSPDRQFLYVVDSDLGLVYTFGPLFTPATYGYEYFELPEGLRVDTNDFALKHEAVNLALADGARGYGDELEPRELEIAGKVWAPTRAAHKDLMDGIRARLRLPGQRIRAKVESDSFMQLGQLKSFRHRWRELSDRTVSEVQATFFVEDPYWYSADLSTETYEVAGNQVLTPDPSAGDNPARTWCSPTITITAPPSGNVPSVLLRNATDGGLQLRYTDLQLRNGASVEIDCFFGTVRRTDAGGTTNTIKFLQGEFLRLLAESNEITYEGAACTITFVWRNRWM